MTSLFLYLNPLTFTDVVELLRAVDVIVVAAVVDDGAALVAVGVIWLLRPLTVNNGA